MKINWDNFHFTKFHLMLPYKQGVVGSNPVGHTLIIKEKNKQIKLTRSISDISEVFKTVLEKVKKEKITLDS